MAAPRILVLGDSIAAADRIPVGRRWSAQLETVLRSGLDGFPVTVVNEARGGSGVELLERQAEEIVLAGFDLVIIISGVNDAAMSVAAWRPRYEAVVERLRDAGLAVVIGTPPPEHEEGAYTQRYAALADALRSIAGDGPLLDLDRHWRESAAPGSLHLDWIHPNEEAQAVIARLAADIVRTWACETGLVRDPV
jgi:lysophospholipase L1-like esterase